MSINYLLLIPFLVYLGIDEFSVLQKYSTHQYQIANATDTVDFPPCNVDQIPHYTSYRTDEEIKIDGRVVVRDTRTWKEVFAEE